MPASLHFLGWDRLPLPLACEWILENHGKQLEGLLIATPGARAARRLREHLARATGGDWTPPSFLTAGTLSDQLLVLDRAPASRLARTLAWEEALRRLGPAEVTRLAAEPPGAGDGAGWRRLAAEVRTLFGELAAEGLDFASVEAKLASSVASGERWRWRVLAKAQEGMLRILEGQGLADAHTGRREALAAGRLRPQRVLLVGVPELNRLTRDVLDRMDEVQALVMAPEELRGRFDELGCVEASAWSAVHTSLSLEQWHVVDEPVQEAERAIQCLAGFGSDKFTPEQVTFGVADEGVTPYLERQLVASGLVPRDAAGRAVSGTPVGKLLRGIHELLLRPAFQPWAALLRHPDLERLLTRDSEQKVRSAAAVSDEYAAAHVPYSLDEPWRVESESRSSQRRRDQMQELSDRLQTLLGPLARDERVPAARWARPLRAFLASVYGTRVFRTEDSAGDWAAVESLRASSAALEELQLLPEKLGPSCSAADALELLRSELDGARTAPLPAPLAARLAAREGSSSDGVVELLGWLELPLDDAPALVVTGFDEGRVPEGMRQDGWLSDSMRTQLGLPDAAQRLARDLYLTELLCRSREKVAFVSSRRSVEGDPVLPSRIALRRPEEEVPGRVKHALETQALRPQVELASGPAYSPPFDPDLGQEPEHWSASAIKDYLSSPYVFWVKRIAGRTTTGDQERELDPLVFGSLAHDVLEAFGRSDLRHGVEPEPIADFLRSTLERLASERFGRGAEPAVRLQVERLAVRLSAFARRQAAETSRGWQIQHVEWTPPDPGDLVLDLGGGEQATFSPWSRIDRIDRHVNGQWRILDYKTGEKGQAPEKLCRKSGEWTDVQLPIYAHLVRSLTGDAPVEVGYVTLGGNSKEIGFALAKWSRDELAEGLDVARGVIGEVRRKLREKEPFEEGRRQPYEPILRALLGVGLVADVDSLSEEETEESEEVAS